MHVGENRLKDVLRSRIVGAERSFKTNAGKELYKETVTNKPYLVVRIAWKQGPDTPSLLRDAVAIRTHDEEQPAVDPTDLEIGRWWHLGHLIEKPVRHTWLEMVPCPEENRDGILGLQPRRRNDRPVRHTIWKASAVREVNVHAELEMSF